MSDTRLAFGLTAGAASAATLTIDASGQLMGAKGLSVGTSLCDVEFLAGTCVERL